MNTTKNDIATIPAIAVKDIEWDSENRTINWVERTVQPLAFERDGMIVVSAENGDGMADYYGEGNGGCPWIHPELEQWAADQGGYWEWENPGCIILAGA